MTRCTLRKHASLYALAVLALLPRGTHGLPSQPVNTTFDDNLPGSQVICTSANWYDIVWFLFANYIMHALSVRSMPGENLFASVVFKFCCLIVPYTGLRRGLCLISRAANLTRSDLQAAARANALCTIVRAEDWKPADGMKVEGCEIEKIKGTRPLHSQGQELQVAESTAAPLGSLISNGQKKEMADCPTTETSTDGGTKKSSVKGSPTVHFALASKLKEKETNVEERGIQHTTTSDSILDLEDGSGTICFNIVDSYIPLPQRGVLEKVFKIFVQTHKFGKHSMSNGPSIDPGYVKIHGMCKLLPGYKLAYIPEDVKVHPRGEPPPRPDLLAAFRLNDFSALFKAMTAQTKLSSTQNAPRIVFSLSQTVSGGWSLYRAQGAQINRFGFAAYGLTVLPYMIVSTVNFIGSLLTKEYEMLYMVHSSIMDEMVSRGGEIDGAVGSIEPKETLEPEGLRVPFVDLPGRQEELVTPEGRTIHFHADSEERFTYSTANTGTTWSPTLSVKRIPTQQFVPLLLERNIWRRYKAWRARRRNADRPSFPPNSTVISVPSHGPLTRLPPPIYEPFLHVLCLALLITAFAIPFIVITVLTGWEKRDSAQRDRNFILNWIIFGMVMGYAAATVEQVSGHKHLFKVLAIAFTSYGSYCISGFVAVVSEMIEGGSCTAVG